MENPNSYPTNIKYLNKTDIKSWQKERKKQEDRKSQLKSILIRSLRKKVGIIFKKIVRKNINTALSQKIYKLEATHREFYFKNLPNNFNNYKILHISDLHFDLTHGIESVILEKLKSEQFDLVLLSGDYREGRRDNLEKVEPALKKLVQEIRSKDGFIGVLGNHDPYNTPSFMGKIGINVLLNETLSLTKGQDKVFITGLDDVHDFYSDQTEKALEESPSGFKIVLVHSPEIYDLASKCNYSLYLCGHTHGGQICLPGGKPIVTNLESKKKFISGIWRYEDMQGFTNRGAGVSSLKVRLNCPPEISKIVLKKK